MAQFVGSLAAAADSGYTQGTVWTAGILTFGNDTTALSCGIRWLNVTVPAAATISSASIHVRARTLVGTITNIHLKMRGHKGDAPQWAEGTFEPDNNFTATTAAPDWDPASWTIDAYYDVDVVFFDDSSTLDNRAQIWWYADGDATANVLTINYTEAAEDVAPSAANQPLERPFNMATLRR
jgi:hypothetical protein